MPARAAAALGLAFVALAGAQEPVTLEPVVVTATRSEQSPLEMPASIDAVNQDTIEAAVPGVNLSEFLEGVPGVLVRDRQNYAQDQQVSVRGFGTRAPFGIVGTKLYVDGIPATMPDGQGQVSHFNFNSAGRIEVLRGPFSVLYGNAAGGVIQIFTAEGPPQPEVSVEAAGGSFGAARASLNARGVTGAVDYNLDYSAFRTDGYREHSAAERRSANARLAWKSGRGRLTLLANSLEIPEAQDPLGLTRAQFETDPRSVSSSALTFDTRKSVAQNQAGLGADWSFGAAHSIHFMSYYGQREIEQYLAVPAVAQANPLHSGGVVDLDNSYAGADLRTTLRGAWLTHPASLTAGLNLETQDSERRGFENFSGAATGVRGNLRRDEQNRVRAFDQYLQLEIEPGPAFKLLAGLRHNEVRFSSADRFVMASNPDDSGAFSFERTTAAAGLLWRAAPDLRLHASWGEGFDSPTFAELAYRPDGASGLNTTLRPARTQSGELGVKWRPHPGTRVDAALFEATTRDEVVVATAQGGRSSFQNADRTRRRGLELGLSTALRRSLSWDLAFTWLDAEFREPFLTCGGRSCVVPDTPVAAGNRVPGVAGTHLHSALRFGSATGWQAALELEHLGSVAVNSANREAAPAYALLGASAGYVWQLPHWRVRASLQAGNLLDENYAGSVIVNDANGQYYEPGAAFNVYAGIDLLWTR